MPSLWILLIIVLVLAVVGSPPVWPHGYGWGPSGLLGVVLVVLLVLLLLGRF